MRRKRRLLAARWAHWLPKEPVDKKALKATPVRQGCQNAYLKNARITVKITQLRFFSTCPKSTRHLKSEVSAPDLHHEALGSNGQKFPFTSFQPYWHCRSPVQQRFQSRLLPWYERRNIDRENGQRRYLLLSLPLWLSFACRRLCLPGLF